MMRIPARAGMGHGVRTVHTEGMAAMGAMVPTEVRVRMDLMDPTGDTGRRVLMDPRAKEEPGHPGGGCPAPSRS